MLTDNFKNRSRAVIATVLLLSFAFCAFGCSFASAAVDGSGEGSGSPDTIIKNPKDTQAPDSEPVNTAEDTGTNNTVTDDKVETTVPDTEPFTAEPVTEKPDDKQNHETDSADTTTIVESDDPNGKTSDNSFDPGSHSIYVMNEGMKLSQTIGDNYPLDYGGQYYGEDGYIHVNVTSTDNIKYYTDIIDESVVKFDIVEFNRQYINTVYSAIKEIGGKYGIYSIGIHVRDNKVHVSTSSSEFINEIKNALSSFDDKSYVIEVGGGIIPQ